MNKLYRLFVIEVSSLKILSYKYKDLLNIASMWLNIIGPTFTKYCTITFDAHKMRWSNFEEKMQSCPKQLTTILDVEDDESIDLLTAKPNET